MHFRPPLQPCVTETLRRTIEGFSDLCATGFQLLRSPPIVAIFAYDRQHS